MDIESLSDQQLLTSILVITFVSVIMTGLFVWSLIVYVRQKKKSSQNVALNGEIMKSRTYISIAIYVVYILGIAVIIGITLPSSIPSRLTVLFIGNALWVIGASLFSLLVSFVIERLFDSIPLMIAVFVASMVSIGCTILLYYYIFIVVTLDELHYIVLGFAPFIQLGIYFVTLLVVFVLAWLVARVATWVMSGEQ